MKTILVVDGAPEEQDCIAKLLHGSDCQIIAALSGAAALDVLKQDIKVDLVISEYQIPDMDGIAFVASVKTYYPALPVILVTSCSSIESYIKSLSCGVFEYMNKPIMAHELRRVIKAATEPPSLDDVVNQ